MKWIYIKHAENSGRFNMEFDLNLAKNVRAGEFYLRLYRWHPFAISLGANQNEAEIDLQKARRDGIDVVKRPTGGRAILHAEELTYSVVTSVDFGPPPRELYNLISNALVKGLIFFNPVFKALELEAIQPDFREELKKPAGSICFSSTARHEVKFAGRKIIGSAQRKMSDAILQHGSILIGPFHRKLVEYLKVPESEKEALKKEMAQKTIEINSILDMPAELPELYNSIKKGFEEEFNCSFVNSEL